MLLVDAANVVGSRPDGWWRDRPRAAGLLVDRLRAAVALGAVTPPVVVVLEGAARPGATEHDIGGVRVVHAPAEGDDTVVAVATDATEGVVVVSADRALGCRCRAVGADVVGPGWLLDRLRP
ncbi:MAG TPA: hypothetical protein VGV86_03505 [Acidimicrobiales bacterium]|nr:hypothetical protein [Acidimicrobiales bacterium]